MDGVIVSLIGIAVVLIAYLCGGFYWAGVVSAKLEQVQQILLKMDGDTTKRLDSFEKDNDLTHKLMWAKHDDLKNRVSVIETRCVELHKAG